MAKLVVPPIDSRLEAILRKVLDAKILRDDALWSLECLPLLYSRLDALRNLVREAQVANAHAPDKSVVDHIFRTLERIRGHLEAHFLTGAPFTIHRLSELMVDYGASGYLLTTVVLAQKYVLALARTIMVVSKETDYLPAEHLDKSSDSIDRLEVDGQIENGILSNARVAENATEAENADSENATDSESASDGIHGSLTDTRNGRKRLQENGNLASAQDYQNFDLPTNIRFVTLRWGESQEEVTGEDAEVLSETSVNGTVQDFDVENTVRGMEDPAEAPPVTEAKTPPSKKMKTSKSTSSSPKISENSLFQLLSPLNMEAKVEDAECSQEYFEEKPLDYKVGRNERYSEEVLF